MAAGRIGELATVLMARVVLGERLRLVRRAGLVLAAIGILLVAASVLACSLARA